MHRKVTRQANKLTESVNHGQGGKEGLGSSPKAKTQRPKIKPVIGDL
jgi:hypothetical protein